MTFTPEKETACKQKQKKKQMLVYKLFKYFFN